MKIIHSFLATSQPTHYQNQTKMKVIIAALLVLAVVAAASAQLLYGGYGGYRAYGVPGKFLPFLFSLILFCNTFVLLFSKNSIRWRVLWRIRRSCLWWLLRTRPLRRLRLRCPRSGLWLSHQLPAAAHRSACRTEARPITANHQARRRSQICTFHHYFTTNRSIVSQQHCFVEIKIFLSHFLFTLIFVWYVCDWRKMFSMI